jgi:hypothetical protein
LLSLCICPGFRIVKRIIVCVLVLAACNTSGRQARAQQEPSTPSGLAPKPKTRASKTVSAETGVINPGKSVGPLRLGDTRERTLELFPFKPHIDEEYSYDDPCPLTEIHWLDRELDAAGVFVYLKGGQVFQIESATPRFQTAEGITLDSSPEDVRRHYPELRAYVLLHSDAAVVGGRDLIFWVDRQKGIAFELYYNRHLRKRRVYKVIIFAPDTEYQPEGCVVPPQSWQELDPYALESPRNKPQRSR